LIQFLPIPELVPFRLTRQLRSVTQPLQENGLMTGVMKHSLDALRSSADLLLTTMDVFIKEPSLDWQVRDTGNLATTEFLGPRLQNRRSVAVSRL